MIRWYLGVDWADREHAVWVEDEQGTKVLFRTVAHTGAALVEFGRWLDEQRAEGRELWAAIERPDGAVVDLLLDHGVVVYPINPKALDRARDRFRMSHAKSDPFDARVLATFLRTDLGHLTALQPSSEAAQELKLLTRDYQRLVRQQARLRNQLIATLKAYYPRPLELFPDISIPRRPGRSCGAFPRRPMWPLCRGRSGAAGRERNTSGAARTSGSSSNRFRCRCPRMWYVRRPGCSRCSSPSWRPP